MILLDKGETWGQLLKASFKSNDTEEWLDVWFTRPIGLVLTLVFRRLRIHPNVVTIVSIFLGIGAGWEFYHHDLMSNLTGVALLIMANFLDSADGQLARLTGQKTKIGRALDGFAGDVWFFCIYFALCCRLMPEMIPGTDITWSWKVWVFAYVCGIIGHVNQAALADYYRQIHLLFLKGAEGSELSSSRQQEEEYRKLRGWAVIDRLYLKLYGRYCRNQERRTPEFQSFFTWYQGLADEDKKAEIRQRFLKGSRPLMKWTNLLTFNLRAIILYITCCMDCPWLYLLSDVTLMAAMYIHMHTRHEKLSRSLKR